MNRVKFVILYNYLSGPLSNLAIVLGLGLVVMSIVGVIGSHFDNIAFSVIFFLMTFVSIAVSMFSIAGRRLKKKQRMEEERDPWRREFIDRAKEKREAARDPWKNLILSNSDPAVSHQRKVNTDTSTAPGYELERREFTQNLDGEMDDMIKKLQARIVGLQTPKPGRRSLDEIIEEVTGKVKLIRENGMTVQAGKDGVSISAGGHVRINRAGDDLTVEDTLPAEKLDKYKPLVEEEPKRASKKNELLDNPLLDD